MYCTNCGAKNEENHKFCTSCGNKLKIEQTNTNNESIETNNQSNNNPSENKTNVCAIVGIIITIFISGLIGLILSIIGLVQSKKLNDGKALSIVGIVLSVLRIIIEIFIIAIMVMAFYKSRDGITDNSSTNYGYEDTITNKSLELDEISYNGIKIEFPADEEDLQEAGLSFNTKMKDIIVLPGKTMSAGSIGTQKSIASVEVTNSSSENKKVSECDITKAIFYNPLDGTTDVTFLGGINYKYTLNEIKNTINDRYIYKMEEKITDAETTLKVIEDNENEYIIFKIVNDTITSVTIQTVDD